MKKLFNEIVPNSGSKYYGLRIEKKDIYYIQARNGNLDEILTANESGIMIEVLVDGHMAYAATSSLDTQSIQYAYDKAFSKAKQIGHMKLANFESSIRGDHKINYKPSYTKKSKISEDILGDKIKFYSDLTQSMKSETNIINASWSTLKTEGEYYYFNSNGAEVFQELNHSYQFLSATGQKDGEIQTRSTPTVCNQGGLELLNIDQSKKDKEMILTDIGELLVAPNCPSGEMDLLLHPDQLYLQIHESIGHPLELDRILGDERNYAGWSFVKQKDFGNLKYGSEKMNITFDPTIENELASYACDDTGIKAEKVYLIKNGILENGIGGVESQKRSGIGGTSSMRSCSWNRAPIDRMANINMEAGDSTIDEMVKSMESGVIMRNNKSWSIDDYRNKFQFGCEIAYEVKDGEIKQTLKNPNYRGVTTPFWNNLKMVGNKETVEVLGSPFCGKGEPNQMVTVGHATPACLFSNIQIFGGQ
ncbi:MAG: putative Zn-dependent protease [Thermoproteota archaeon]|jgi:predicted Zn-dependent protease